MSTTSTELIQGVDFATVPTRDLEAAVEFYGTTLGLPMSVHIPDRHFAEFETGNLTLSVMEPERMGMEFQPNRNPLALHVAGHRAGAAGARAARRVLRRRHARHRRLPHGLLRRPRRQRADAAPPLCAARDPRLSDAARPAGRRVAPRRPGEARAHGGLLALEHDDRDLAGRLLLVFVVGGPVARPSSSTARASPAPWPVARAPRSGRRAPATAPRDRPRGSAARPAARPLRPWNRPPGSRRHARRR